MLKFLDDTQFSVFGLDEIFADLHAGGRVANDETAEEIIRRLEEMKNYIPEAEKPRREYAYILLREYRKFLKEEAEKAGSQKP